MSLATDYGADHRQPLIRSARVATLCTVTLAERHRAERERRVQEMTVPGFDDLLATLASRDPDAHDHLQVLMHGVIVRRQPVQALQAAAARYALALLEKDEGAR